MLDNLETHRLDPIWTPRQQQMHLYNKLLKKNTQRESGFSLTELLLAVFIGAFISLVAGDTLLSHIKSTAKLEALERLRSEWGRVTNFIEAEVALSERVIYNPDSINLNQCKNTIAPKDFYFALEIGKEYPLSIYYSSAHASDGDNEIWNGDASLYRCGPDIGISGEYNEEQLLTNLTSKLEVSRVVDGLTQECTISVTKPSGSDVSKSLNLDICIQGLGQRRFNGQINTYSRVSPIYSYPVNTTLCSDADLTIEGFVKVAGTSENEELSAPDSSQAVLICGNGGNTLNGASEGDQLNGSKSHDIIETGPTSAPGAEVNGGDGDDRLVGGDGDDILNGGNGNDVILGLSGNDTLTGGSGSNKYLPGLGNDSINGGPGLDVVFLEHNRAAFDGLSSCSRISCILTYSTAGDSFTLNLSNVEVLVFRDGRYDL